MNDHVTSHPMMNDEGLLLTCVRLLSDNCKTRDEQFDRLLALLCSWCHLQDDPRASIEEFYSRFGEWEDWICGGDPPHRVTPQNPKSDRHGWDSQ